MSDYRKNQNHRHRQTILDETMRRVIRQILSKPYARILIPDDDGTYTAEILEFPGCYGEGDTAEEAIKDLELAAASWIEAALKQHQEIPEPLDTYGYSGKINLRLPKSIHKQAVRFAQREDISLNQFFVSAIAARVGAEELYERLGQMLQSRAPSVVTILNVTQHTSTLISLAQLPETCLEHLQYRRTEDILDKRQLPTVELNRIAANV